jgi:hypothetical protein
LLTRDADHFPHLKPAAWVPEPPVFPEAAAEEAADRVMEAPAAKPVREPAPEPVEVGFSRAYLPAKG